MGLATDKSRGGRGFITRKQRILLANAARKQKARNDFWKRFKASHANSDKQS